MIINSVISITVTILMNNNNNNNNNDINIVINNDVSIMMMMMIVMMMMMVMIIIIIIIIIIVRYVFNGYGRVTGVSIPPTTWHFEAAFGAQRKTLRNALDAATREGWRELASVIAAVGGPELEWWPGGGHPHRSSHPSSFPST